mgnify:CR=1 FL=1
MNLEMFLHLLMIVGLLVCGVVAPLLVKNAEKRAGSLILGWLWEEHWWVLRLLSVIIVVYHLVQVLICDVWHLEERTHRDGRL